MSLVADLQKFAAKAKLRMETVAQSVPLELTGRVIQASPIDTGRFRANWNMATGRPDLTTTDSTQDNALQRAQAIQVRLGDDVFVTNNLPYAKPLEEGSSSKAPHGMVAVSIRAFSETVKQAVSDAKSKHP